MMLRGTKAFLFFAIFVILTNVFSLAHAQGGVEYEFAFAVHTISDNKYIRC